MRNAGADEAMTKIMPVASRGCERTFYGDNRMRRTENASKGPRKAAKDACEDLVDHVDVAAEPVENGPERRRLEEQHRRADDGMEPVGIWVSTESIMETTLAGTHMLSCMSLAERMTHSE